MTVDAGIDQTICDGEQATLTALASSGNNYTIGVTANNSSIIHFLVHFQETILQ